MNRPSWLRKVIEYNHLGRPVPALRQKSLYEDQLSRGGMVRQLHFEGPRYVLLKQDIAAKLKAVHIKSYYSHPMTDERCENSP